MAKILSVIVGAMMVFAYQASAAFIYWTDWNTSAPGNPGTATGTMDIDGTTVNVTYTGEFFGAQTNGGTDYWNPATPYLSSTIDNAPTTTDIIHVTGGTGVTNTITFSQAVTDPVMALVSLGQPWNDYYVTYEFDQSFTVLSSGTGYWGGGPFYNIPGTNALTAQEGHGAIQFQGAVTSISWVSHPYEYWHGFTVGAPGIASPAVPEPGTLALLGLGLFGLAFAARRRK